MGHLPHGGQAQGRGRVPQAQQVGGKIEGDLPLDGLIPLVFREQPPDDRRHGLGQQLGKAAFLGDFQKPQPGAHAAQQEQREFHRLLGAFQQGGGELSQVAGAQGAHHTQKDHAAPDEI